MTRPPKFQIDLTEQFATLQHAPIVEAANSTFDAARISRFVVTRVAVPRCCRSLHGLGAAFFCVRSSDSAQLSSYAVLYSRVVASRVCGRGRSESPSAAVACLGCRLNSVSPDGDGAARRWGCNHRRLVSAVTTGATPPPASEASKAASDRLMRPMMCCRSFAAF
jgi:hypothetical protein